MPRPTGAGEFGIGTASPTTFTAQPSFQDWDFAPVVTRGDGGGVQDGLHAVTLGWFTMTPATFDQVKNLVNTIINAAGIGVVRLWDEDASSGAGAWATKAARFRQKLTFDEPDHSPNYRNVRLTISSLDIT
jgi:hypothetical protein